MRRGATVRFTLSENAAVTIRFKKGSKTLRTARLSARAGSRAVTVRGSKLVKGRYSVEIEARDARGNRAPTGAQDRPGDPLMNTFRPPADAWSRRDFMRNGSYSLALVCTFGTRPRR